MGQLWRTLNRRVGKVQQAVVLGVLATAIAVPIAVAGPQGSANLQTTPTTTATATTSVSGTVAVITAPSGGSVTLVLGGSLCITGLQPGTHSVTAVTTSGQRITGTVTTNANCAVTAISSNLAGVPLSSLSIVLGASSTAQTPAQTPVQVPATGAPGQIPAQLPHTGAGGGTL